ncbi:MAG TPA: 1-deoxy-D-xylulose-5-phosphate synthase N-terminal domain-containing protein, partial [Kiritimatiellia bacterium]|nr:1-deoxy-D-xylulose-5-phosphate synthase N-terminal domain-containing protein [Kiritimatiellia bacterium]
MSNLLKTIRTPADVQVLESGQLPVLAEEIREAILETVSRNGGHLASNLGAVELTIAILRAFSPPQDKVIWDVGHQTYAWKLLTGRRERFHTLRQRDGLSGFTRPE